MVSVSGMTKSLLTSRSQLARGKYKLRTVADALLDWAAMTNSTHLDLLTSAGVLSVTFTPALTPENYTELATIVRETDTADELKLAVQQAAIRWGREVVID